MDDNFEDYDTGFTKRATSKKAKSRIATEPDERSSEELFVDRIDDKDKAIVVEESYGRFKLFYNNEMLSGVKLKRGTGFKYFGFIVPGDYARVVKDDLKYCISNIQKRTSKISRIRRTNPRRGTNSAEYENVIAANIDAVIAVVSANNPPLHINAIDRYLIIIQRNNIEPILCMNKADLAKGYEEGLLKEYVKLGIKYVKTSTVKNEGIEELKKMISNKMVVFIGHSGVGKSSLINAISGNLVAREGKVCEKTGQGKHTTTTSALYKWKENSYIIDTPGIRSFGIGKIPKEELQLYFPEFDAYRTICKYGNCLHNHENEHDCGVKQALSKGEVSKNRYDSYIRLLEEL